MAKNKKFQINDTVKVKNGTIAPDLGIDISGWHGQILEIVNDLVIINLDSIALTNISDQYIFQCEQDNLDWERICLKSHEIQIAVRRDTEEDLRTIRKKIQAKHYWDYLGASGKIINQVLTDIDSSDHSAALSAWEKYLDGNFSLPFDAEISEYQDSGLLKQGDKIRIHSITGNEDPYGVIAKIKLGRKAFHFPICDIEAIDKTSINGKVVTAYTDWFGNR
jgi:hypothetical protein